MKNYILYIAISLLPVLNWAQTNETKGRFGIAINSSMNGEVYPIRLVPSITYLKGNSQVEAGFGLHPFIRKNETILSGELNYKYFPNGTDKKFNLYLIARLSYINNQRETYYPSNYNYLFLNGGYGFQITPFESAYMGTNFTFGTFTYSKTSEVPYDSFGQKSLFESFGVNLAFQFNIGYRF